MTSDDKPLRLHPRKKRAHAASASRRIAFGLSAATAAVLSSAMADSHGTASAAPATTVPPTTLEPIIVHVQVTRPWVPPAPTPARVASVAPRQRATSPAASSSGPPQAPAATQPSSSPPTFSPAPRTAPPTTQSRAS